MSTQTETPQITDQDLERRTALIEGLRQLADFYAANPSVPVPLYPELNVHVRASDDTAGVAEVERIAAALGVDVKYGAHVSARRTFAGLRLDVTYISRAHYARYVDHMARYEPDDTPLAPVTTRAESDDEQSERAA